MLEVAIVGLGKWGQYLVDCIQGKSEKLRFGVAVTARPDALLEFCTRHRMRIETNYDQVLNDPDLAGVVLATPHSMHHQQILKAAKKGKHVFVEKPLALSVNDAEDAFHACDKSGVGLFVGYNWRFQPALMELYRIAQSGRLGNLLHLEGNYSGPSGFNRSPGSWRTWRNENPAGGMTGRGVHVLNAMNWICGPVTSIFAYSDRRATTDELDDTTSVLLRFNNNVTGYIGACQVTAEFWRLHIFGTKGWAEMRMESELTICQIGEGQEKINFPCTIPEIAELNAFADAISSASFSKEAIRDAINGVACLEAIEVSARTGNCVHIKASRPL